MTLSGQTPAEADFNLLDTARKTELYGIQLHAAQVFGRFICLYMFYPLIILSYLASFSFLRGHCFFIKSLSYA